MRLHSLICRAEKPTVRESEESENDSSASPSRRPKRRRINGPPKGQMDDDPSKIVFKECNVLIKKTNFIELEIRKGYSSIT